MSYGVLVLRKSIMVPQARSSYTSITTFALHTGTTYAMRIRPVHTRLCSYGPFVLCYAWVMFLVPHACALKPRVAVVWNLGQSNNTKNNGGKHDTV